MPYNRILLLCSALLACIGLTACGQQVPLDSEPTTLPTESSAVLEHRLETPAVVDLSIQSGGAVAFRLPIDPKDAQYICIGDAELRMFRQGEDVTVDASSLQPGEHTATIVQGDQQITFPVYVVTAMISSAEELQDAANMENADTGYFILGNNIDCKEIQEPICFLEESYFETSLGENRQGFRGGFNGMGYTISNLKVPENGLFGCIGASGVVRNVAFTNISSPDPDASVLCRDSAGLVSQVYVQGDFSRVLYASYSPSNKLENIVAESTRSGAMLCQHIASVDTDGYSVSEVSALIMVGKEAKVSGWSRIQKFSNVTMDTLLWAYSRETRESVPAVAAKDGFNSYWDITSGYPIFISSNQ